MLKRASAADRRVGPRCRVRPRRGNPDVVMCERGIRTFETATRFTLDVAAVPIAKKRLGLPVIVDPSHAAGHLDWVECLTLAGVACGGDGLLVETHPEPAQALSDGPQAVPLSEFPALMEKRAASRSRGRSIPRRPPRSRRLLRPPASGGAPALLALPFASPRLLLGLEPLHDRCSRLPSSRGRAVVHRPQRDVRLGEARGVLQQRLERPPRRLELAGGDLDEASW